MALTYIPILSYYRIIDGIDSPLCVKPDEFARQMKWLRDNGFHGMTLADAVAGRAGRLSGQAGGAGGAGRHFKGFTVTFDHGYADTYRNALPVLKEFRIPAHVFLVTDLVDTKNLLSLPEAINTQPDRDRLMTWDEVATLKESGIEIGSMTASHPDLTAISEEAAADEIGRSRDTIRGFLGSDADYFCYPFGRMNPHLKEMVKNAGYRGAAYTPAGKTGGMDRYSLRRIAVPGGVSDRAFQFKLTEKADSLRENPALFGIMKALGKAWE